MIPPRSTTPAASASSPICTMRNRTTSSRWGCEILLNLDHRGAVGADPKLGDGCGILVQIPHDFFKAECAKLGIALPAPGDYAIGQFFLPRDPGTRASAREHHRDVGQGRRSRRARLARSAGRLQRSRRGGEGRRAASRANFHRPRAGCGGRRYVRAAHLFGAQDDVERNLYARQRRARSFTPSRCRRAPSSTRAWCSSRSSANISSI